jgi:hypothetical protein
MGTILKTTHNIETKKEYDNFKVFGQSTVQIKIESSLGPQG